MKISGREFVLWHDTAFPEGYYLDDCAIETHHDDGSWALDPDQVYNTDDLGNLVPKDPEDACLNSVVSIDYFVKRWRKHATEAQVTITVPKADLEELLALAKERKWSAQAILAGKPPYPIDPPKEEAPPRAP